MITERPDAIDDIMSRLASIKDDDDSTVLASYRYLGAGRIVTEDYEEIQVNLDYAGDTNTFSALDRFGRVTDQVWNDYGATPDVVLDEYTYTYDRVGNRESRDNELKTDGSLDESYDYDDLYRLIDFDRGTGSRRIGTFWTRWVTGRTLMTTGRRRRARLMRRTRLKVSPAAGSRRSTTLPGT